MHAAAVSSSRSGHSRTALGSYSVSPNGTAQTHRTQRIERNIQNDDVRHCGTKGAAVSKMRPRAKAKLGQVELIEAVPLCERHDTVHALP